MSDSMDNQIDESYRENMNKLAIILNRFFNQQGKKEHGFCLLVFPLNKEGRMQWITNAEKESMLSALRELCGYAENKDPSINTN